MSDSERAADWTLRHEAYAQHPAPPRESRVVRLEEVLEGEAPPERNYLRPLLLFLATCVTTWMVDGPFYMLAVMGILLTHEMGHFLQAVRYGIPASLPHFIPFPSLVGTMGAVIAMQSSQGDRKQLFDIGLTGPIAGLVVAIPVLIVGILQADVAPSGPVGPDVLIFTDPLLMKWLIAIFRPDVPQGQELILNPLLRAGWFGLLLTGLNMMPIGQLDGGHVTYALFGPFAHLIARGTIIAAMIYMVISGNFFWVVMVVLVLFIGVDHPPTANDQAPLGWKRRLIGFASLLIPVFCFTLSPFGNL